MHLQDLIGGIEAILFASANPMTEADLKKAVARWMANLPSPPVESANAPTQLELPVTPPPGEPTMSEESREPDGAAGPLSPGAPQVQADGSVQPPQPISQAALEAAGSAAAFQADGDGAPRDLQGHGATAAGAGLKDGSRLAPDVAHSAAELSEDTPLPELAERQGDRAEASKMSGAYRAPADAPPAPPPGHFDWKKQFKAAIAAVKARWQEPSEHCGFALVQIADALTFRTNPRFAAVLLAMRDERPPKLSRAAMETLAIIAYRQPVTKPEADHIRGVDCGGTIKMLLERDLVRIVGKKEEAGRPLLYGTGPEFLSFFNLASVHHLPSLRAFDELNDDSEDALAQLDALPSLQELSAQAKQFRLDDEPAMGSLDAAVEALRRTETHSRQALAAQGIALEQEEADDPSSAPGDDGTTKAPPTQH